MPPGVRSDVVEAGVLLITIDRPPANAIDSATRAAAGS